MSKSKSRRGLNPAYSNAVRFSKMVATGNDFVVIDNRLSAYGRQSYTVYRPLAGRLRAIPSFAKKLCDRRNGIGADGLLLLERSRIADFKMRIFNPDGSEPGMCGNGSRCIALYAYTNKIASAHMKIETEAGILSAQVKKRLIKINMTEPKDVKLAIDIKLYGESYQFHYIDTGVPHVVCFTKSPKGTRALNKIDVDRIGREIRFHKRFIPSGTNVDFVQPKGEDTLIMRSYERGIEAETAACGTGAVASALISSIINKSHSPVKVRTIGGLLTVYFKKAGDAFKDVFLEGEAREVFKGELKISV